MRTERWGNVPRRATRLTWTMTARTEPPTAWAQDSISPGIRLLLHRHVALLVGGRAAQDHDVEREGLEAQPVFPVDAQELHDLLLRRLVLAAAELAGIDECMEPVRVIRPGRPAAISRINCEITPWGIV